jgi:hypothetical protein
MDPRIARLSLRISPIMDFNEQGLLEITPDPRRAPTRIPLLGPVFDRRIRALEEEAFARAERAVLEAVGRDGDIVLYPHSFLRGSAARSSSGSPAAAAVVGMAVTVAGGARSTRTPVVDRLLGAVSQPYYAARIAAVTERSIILASPTRRNVALTRIALGDIRAVLREDRDVVLKLAGQEIRIEGLAQPRRFVEETRRCIARYEGAHKAVPADAGTASEADEVSAACEVAAIRRRLRARGWMLAVANDYRLHGRWHVFYSFSHPEGLSAKGEGTSDLDALRLAEADVLAKEARYCAPQELAA